MTSPEFSDLLNELLAHEQQSVVLRFEEAGLFVSRLSVRQRDAVRAMAARSREHAHWLADLILSLDLPLGPRQVDARSAEVHYWEVRFALPRLIRDQEQLVDRYESAMDRLAAEPAAAGVVGRILARHRDSLAELQSFAGTQESPR